MSTFIALVQILTRIDSPSEMENFLNGLLTPKEKDELVRRLAIVKMLKKNIPQRTIAEKLGVGVATVTRGSKEIKQGRFENV